VSAEAWLAEGPYQDQDLFRSFVRRPHEAESEKNSRASIDLQKFGARSRMGHKNQRPQGRGRIQTTKKNTRGFLILRPTADGAKLASLWSDRWETGEQGPIFWQICLIIEAVRIGNTLSRSRENISVPSALA